MGLATGLVVALFPAAAIGTGLLVGTTAGGALLGSLAGHAAAGMSRSDLKEAGEALDAGTAGLVVVGVADMQSKIEAAMKKAQKIEAKQLKADAEAIEKDAVGRVMRRAVVLVPALLLLASVQRRAVPTPGPLRPPRPVVARPPPPPGAIR